MNIVLVNPIPTDTEQFHDASKECFWKKQFLNFMQGFKSAILPKVKNFQYGTFEV